MKKAEMLGVWFILQEEVKNQRIREEIQQTVKVSTAKTKSMVIGFYDYFFAGISDGSIHHGNNSAILPLWRVTTRTPFL